MKSGRKNEGGGGGGMPASQDQSQHVAGSVTALPVPTAQPAGVHAQHHEQHAGAHRPGGQGERLSPIASNGSSVATPALAGGGCEPCPLHAIALALIPCSERRNGGQAWDSTRTSILVRACES